MLVSIKCSIITVIQQLMSNLLYTVYKHENNNQQLVFATAAL